MQTSQKLLDQKLLDLKKRNSASSAKSGGGGGSQPGSKKNSITELKGVQSLPHSRKNSNDSGQSADQVKKYGSPNPSQFQTRQVLKKKPLYKHQKLQGTTPTFENIVQLEKEKTQNDINFLVQALKNHFVFYNLSETQLEKVVAKMFYCEVKPDQYLFKQDSEASSFFVLEQGQLDLIINNEKKKNIFPGEGFGELALLYNCGRSGSIFQGGLKSAFLWGIDRQTFSKTVEEINAKEFEQNRKFLENVKFCKNLTKEQKDSVASVLVTLKYQPKQKIVVEGDPGSSFYIIKKGSVGVYKGTKEVRRLQVGDSFGEQALYFSQVRTMTCMAEEDTICIALGRDVLTQILGDQVQVIGLKNQQRWAFEKSHILSKLTKIQMEKILDVMKICSYRKGDIVFKKGSFKNQKIVICLESAIKQASNDTIIAQKGSSIGEEFIDSKSYDTYEDDMVVENDGTLSEIDSKKFIDIIGSSIEEMIKKNAQSHEKKIAKGVEKLFDASNISIEDWVFLKELGSGQFGQVYLVCTNQNSTVFALKSINKAQVIEQSLEKHLQQEKQVMEKCQFPLIMQFIRSYQDKDQVYFLLEYIRGMELFDVIREIGLLNTTDSQFYIGSMILCIEYLHAQGIIYRDLKPENVMVNQNGIMKLIDMGTAKIINKLGGGTNRTFTIIGTPHYMAPEVITGKGYTMLVDLWSIGICLYEFMCGRVPFGEEVEDPYEIYEEIIKNPIQYPSYLKDRKARKLMDQLLNKVPEVRLGGSFAALKANPWFDAMDWDKLADCQIKPPFIPPLNFTEFDTKQKTNKGVKVLEIIKEELIKSGYQNANRRSKDPSWDKEF